MLSNTAVKPPHQVNFLNQRFSAGVSTTLGGILEIGGVLFFFFKFYFIFRLYITVLVWPNIKMNPPQV